MVKKFVHSNNRSDSL